MIGATIHAMPLEGEGETYRISARPARPTLSCGGEGGRDVLGSRRGVNGGLWGHSRPSYQVVDTPLEGYRVHGGVDNPASADRVTAEARATAAAVGQKIWSQAASPARKNANLER